MRGVKTDAGGDGKLKFSFPWPKEYQGLFSGWVGTFLSMTFPLENYQSKWRQDFTKSETCILNFKRSSGQQTLPTKEFTPGPAEAILGFSQSRKTFCLVGGRTLANQRPAFQGLGIAPDTNPLSTKELTPTSPGRSKAASGFSRTENFPEGDVMLMSQRAKKDAH